MALPGPRSTPRPPLKPENISPQPIPHGDSDGGLSGNRTPARSLPPSEPKPHSTRSRSATNPVKVGKPRLIRAVPPLLVGEHDHPGSLQSLVLALDFAPRHRSLAVDLARRFSSSHKALGHPGSAQHGEELRERFFSWLLERVIPEGMRNPSAGRFRSPSEAELRLMGLLDQYRAGGQRPQSADCPLVRAAQSIES